MRDFEYRAPRFLVSATFFFETKESCTSGICTNVSRGGVSALINESTPSVSDAGSIVLRYPQQQFQLKALVTHVQGQEVGFSFVPRTRDEEAAAAEFAAFFDAHVPESVGRHLDKAAL